MDDLISRQAAIDAVCEHGTDLERRGIMVLSVANHKQATVDLLESLLSVQERKGRWVELYDSNYKCSECGAWWHSDDMDINEEFRFCPSCGAHMEGVEDGNQEE